MSGGYVCEIGFENKRDFKHDEYEVQETQHNPTSLFFASSLIFTQSSLCCVEGELSRRKHKASTEDETKWREA